jgi:polyphosphate kinase
VTDLQQPPEALAPTAVDLEAYELYFNRELSWLDFNDRVLQLGEDSSVPLLERTKFCAIWESNLDEFFMVRVANLHEQLEAGIDARGADGMGASQQIDAIAARPARSASGSAAASSAICAPPSPSAASA